MKLISLNIEGYNHTESVLNYLIKRQPDIVCLQEIHEDTFEAFKRQLHFDGVFTAMVKKPKPHETIWGVAILCRFPFTKSESAIYDVFTEDYPEFKGSRPERPKAVLLTAELKGGTNYKPIVIACTHFTWSPNSMVTEQQKANFKNLIPLLDKQREMILCGDFNSPRGKEIYDTLASRYYDNIPPDITSTLDPELHRAGQFKLVVDGLFSTAGYNVQAVKVVNHLSDHCAIEADITVVPQ